MVQEAAVEMALATLRPGLTADGFDLRVGTLTEGTVRVILEAKPDACLDCLVPDDLMVQMLDDAIRRNDDSLGTVELIREGFEDIESH
jgi:molybdopterin/thiamine biosynthesis adenylyltransferase